MKQDFVKWMSARHLQITLFNISLVISLPLRPKIFRWFYFVSFTQTQKVEKLSVLVRASMKLNLLRTFVRLLKDTSVINAKKYIFLQANMDEIGRMLGGWIRSTKDINSLE